MATYPCAMINILTTNTSFFCSEYLLKSVKGMSQFMLIFVAY